MKNIESFKEINIKFNNFESSKRLSSDKDNNKEDLTIKDILIIKDQ